MKTTPLLVLAILLAVGITACSPTTDVVESPTPATSSSNAPEPTESVTTGVAEPAVTYPLGDLVPAGEVDAARTELAERGLGIYASPNGGGEGAVFDPSDGEALTEILAPDIDASGGTQKYRTITDLGQAGLALQAISKELALTPGASAFVMIRTADFAPGGEASDWGYTLVAIGKGAVDIANAPQNFLGDTAIQETKSGALTAFKSITSQIPSAPVIDLT